MKPAALVAVPSCASDADHHLATCNDGRDQLAASDAARLGDRERGREQGCPGMHAAAWPGQIVHLEGVRERPVGERGGRRMHERATRTKNAAIATGSVCLSKAHDHAAPGQVVAEDDDRYRIGDALLGTFHHVGRDVLVAKCCGIFCQELGFVRHLQIPRPFNGGAGCSGQRALS